MKTINQVINSTLINNFIDELYSKYDVKSDRTKKIFTNLINLVVVECKNYEIAYEDDNIDRFKEMFFNIFENHYLDIILRARFLIETNKFFGDENNFVIKQIDRRKNAYGYEGFNADGTFRNDTSEGESYVDNPFIFMKEVKNYFGDIINNIIEDVKQYCLQFY